MLLKKPKGQTGQPSFFSKLSNFSTKGNNGNKSANSRKPSAISKRVTAFVDSVLGPKPNKNPHVPPSGLLWEPPEPPRRDRMPRNKPDLEVRLNYHLSELDRIRKYVEILNEIKEEHEAKVRNVKQRVGSEDMLVSIEHMEELVGATAEARKAYGSHIAYHRGELERIADRYLQISRLNGERMALPAVFANLANDYMWRSLYFD